MPVIDVALKRRRFVSVFTVLASVATLTLSVAVADAASRSTAVAHTGTVPPADPTAYCRPDKASIDQINYCRAKEGVGPLVLPSNYSSLTVPQQLLVVINLERVNRGEVPIPGLNAAINTIAQAGADKGDDPGFPDDAAGSAIWAPALSVLDADVEWMYSDECSPSNVVGCWPHRDSILDNSEPSTPYVGGAGYTAGNVHDGGYTYNSYTFEFLFDYHSDELAYTWAQELPFFATPPSDEPLGAPTSSPSATPTVTPTATPTVTASASPSSTPSATPSVAPATISRVGASHLTGHKEEAFGSRLKVQVTSADGTPVPGALVTFEVTKGSSGFANSQSVTVTTHANGLARSPVLYAAYKKGVGRVVATTPGAEGSVAWHLTIKK